MVLNYEDAPDTTSGDTGELSRLKSLGQQAAELLQQAEALESRAGVARKAAREILEHQLPDAMDEIGLVTFALSDGTVFLITDIIAASIRKDKEEAAFDWLRENNHGDLIKRELKITFGKGEDNIAGDVAALITERTGNPVSDKASVHASTLKAWVKEQMAAGNLDMAAQDLLGVYTARQVKITK